MNDKTNKEEVQSEPKHQTSQDIKSYWTKEKRDKAVPLPIPLVSPPQKVRDRLKGKEQFVNNSELVSDPVQPEHKKP